MVVGDFWYGSYFSAFDILSNSPCHLSASSVMKGSVKFLKVIRCDIEDCRADWPKVLKVIMFK